MRRLVTLGCVLLPALALSQADAQAPPDILLFARARTKMQDHLKNQPNYICLETLERTTRDPLKKRTTLLDILRLEVAYVDHKELYAWPGSHRFEDTELTDMAPGGGVIGTGAFATHAHNLFLTNLPRILPGEWAELDGRRVARFPYEVAEMVSGFRLRASGSAWAVVGYYGSIWIDPEREEVTRVEIIADQIPTQLGLKESRSMIKYDDVKISGESYRLPVRLIQSTLTFGDHLSRNEGRFNGCRQFVGESKLSFGDPPPEEAPTPQTATEVSLPADLSIVVQLTSPIDSETSKTGDLIEAVLAAPIKQKKQILFDKGAKVDGRLIRMQRVGGVIHAEIQFYSITAQNRRAAFIAKPQAPAAASQLPLTAGRPQVQAGTRVGSLEITIESSRLTLLKGSRSQWLSTAPAVPNKKDS